MTVPAEFFGVVDAGPHTTAASSRGGDAMIWIGFGLGCLCGLVVGFGIGIDSAPDPLSEPLPRPEPTIKPMPARRMAWTDHSRN